MKQHIIFTHVHVDSIVLWGFVGSILVTTIMYACRGLGLSRMSFPILVGTLFTSNRDRAQVLGFLCYLLVGWIVAIVYALVFESLGRATWWIGALGGFIHGLFVLATIVPLLPSLHPRVASEYDGPTPTRMLEPPGFLALNYGRGTPIATMVAHVVYGGVLGAFYRIVGS